MSLDYANERSFIMMQDELDDLAVLEDLDGLDIMNSGHRDPAGDLDSTAARSTFAFEVNSTHTWRQEGE